MCVMQTAHLGFFCGSDGENGGILLLIVDVVQDQHVIVIQALARDLEVGCGRHVVFAEVIEEFHAQPVSYTHLDDP